MKVGKKLVVILAGVVALASVAFSGCLFKRKYLPEFESEYYRYAVRTMKDGEKEAYLVGFTELGLQQKYLILPNELDGIDIIGIGYLNPLPLGIGDDIVCDFKSENLTKFFAPFKTTKKQWSNSYASINCSVIIWKLETKILRFYGEYCYGYNLLNGLLQNLKDKNINERNETRIANVSYMYNYEEAGNEGYYWVDYYNEATIDFIPPEPEREGYTFGGWYKEPECINKWDFETDVTSKELWVDTELEYEDYNPETLTWLYAKWI